MKCLYCGKKIALLRKLKDSEFCKDEHRQQYLREQEQMALARLTGSQLWAKGEKADRDEAEKVRTEAAQAAPEVKAGLKSFLPLPPHVISRKGFLRLRPDTFPQLPDVWLPEFRVAVDTSDLRISIAETAAKAPAAVLELAAGQDQPRPDPEAVVPPEAGLRAPSIGPDPTVWMRSAGAAFVPYLEHELAWPISLGLINVPGVPLQAPHPGKAGLVGQPIPPPSLTAAAAAVPETFVELFAVALVLPLAFLRPMAGAAPPPEPELLPETAAPPLPHAAPAAHTGPEPLAFPLLPAFSPALASREADLEFLALPATEPEFVEVPDVPLTDPPASISIYALHPPRTQTIPLRPRKPRTREIFFATPRLHDLPALAAAVARSNWEAKLTSPGTKPWEAGPLSLPARLQPIRTGSLPSAILAFEAAGEPAAAALPVLAVPPANPQLPWARQAGLDGCAAAGFPAAPPAAAPLTAEAWNTDVQEPALTAAPVALALAAAGLQAPNPLTASAGSQPLIRCSTPSPLDGGQSAAPRSPTWIPARISTAMRASGGLAPVKPTGNGGRHTPRRFGPEFEPLAGASPPETAYPAAASLAGGAPPLISEMWPVLPAEALPYPASTVAMQPLEAAWPEGNAQLPRLRAGILEDRALRERLGGRLGGRTSAGGRMGRLFHGFSPPAFAIPARPDAKWLVMLVPVALLLAVYSLTGGGAKPRPVTTAQTSTPAPAEAAAIIPEALAEAPASPAGNSRRRRKLTPAEPPVAVAAPEPVAIVPAAAESNAGFADGVKASIMRRAAISFTDDFRTGLADWQGGDNWSTQWSYDAAGFLNTGPLALYSPSMSLSNYRMEFLGQIDRKSLGWVFRAKDLKNYYATKITLVRGGPLPSAVIERYAVINGKESQHQRRPLPLQIRTDTLYRVRMDVNDEDFTLTVQGQVVDHWSDSSLKHGGIGFFSAKGELARLRWVEVSHQYDFLGRLCALLVPYQIPARDGSLK